MIAKLLSCGVVVAALATLHSHTLPGLYALQTGKEKALAHLVATAMPNDPLSEKLDISLGDDTGTIRRYDIDMTKYLHLIIVSDDLRTFMHVHPQLHPNGHFTIVQRFPSAALYHIYSDGEPAGLGQQVFRYDLDLRSSTIDATRDLAPTGDAVSAGPYRVALDSTVVRAGRESHIRVRVTENGKPAADLHPYLGALAHAVFIDTDDLTYAHVHPQAPGASMAGMDMSGGSMQMSMPALADSDTSSPNMELHVAVRERGVYKLWLQFRGGGSLHVAAFVITAT